MPEIEQKMLLDDKKSDSLSPPDTIETKKEDKDEKEEDKLEPKKEETVEKPPLNPDDKKKE